MELRFYGRGENVLIRVEVSIASYCVFEGQQKHIHWPGSAAGGGWFCAAAAEAAAVVLQSVQKEKEKR